MTSERVPTPASIRRQDTINDATTAAEHLLSVLRGYRAARRDGFPMAHLARIEAVLDDTKTQARRMLDDERDTLIRFGLAVDEAQRLSLYAPPRFSAAKPATAAGVAPVLTLPPDDDLDIPQSTAGDCN
ncbi:hypothetical protein [Brevibacterium casei]|uniref:hypothetical protein n=1 Tax=Brevibacterium casei TaxID=33889 RepID=UPI00241E1428|nr:hypothetical protein [Brevibacterium casei]